MRSRLWRPLLLITLALTCKDSGPGTLNVAGTWLVSQNWNGDSVSCSFAAESLFLTQTDTALRGHVRSGLGACTLAGVPSPPVAQAADSLSNAFLKGRAIAFDITQQLHYQGLVTGGVATGNLSGAIVFGPPINHSVALTGNWTATRQ
jgi:hypothetical protein